MCNQQEWTDFCFIFQWENGGAHAGDWPLFKTPTAEALLKAKAQQFGALPSIGAYVRAFNELKASGEIRQVRQTDPLNVEQEKHLTVEEYNRLPASEVVRRFCDDKRFAADVNALISAGLI